MIKKSYVRKTCKTIIASVLLVATAMEAEGKEGMWLPPNLKSQEREMRAMGLQIAIDEIYNENGKGLNNAIVLFGRGCTGEIISPKGLILTNHHCGYGSAQSLSSADHDYFANGYWAKNHGEELPVKGLTVTFIRKIVNVTDEIVAGLADTMNDDSRDSIVKKRIGEAEERLAKETGYDATIKPYFKGNEYWVALSETFKDIRFVGFPPNGIGAFGGDEENWMWPRHTGDFSIFRVYAGPDNKPADYSADNKPYETKEFFEINTAGYREGDMTMVYGFPGTTNEYISSYALEHVTEVADPIAIEARTLKLDVWTKHMSADRDIFIKYTSKRAGVANGWKKWQGELKGLNMNHVSKKKRKYEHKFDKWASKDETLPYADGLVAHMEREAEDAKPAAYKERYINEAAMGVELLQVAANGDKLLQCLRQVPRVQVQDSLAKLVKGLEGFYKNYDAATDKDVFAALITLYMGVDELSTGVSGAYMATNYRTNGNDMNKWAEVVYAKSVFADYSRLKKWAETADSNALKNDAGYALYAVVNEERKELLPKLAHYNTAMEHWERLYMKARMVKDKDDVVFYPDANLTLRLTYGKVDGLNPDGPAHYAYQTTLDDMIALDDTTRDIFRVPARLKELYQKKQYGRWGVNGTVPLAFVASNHTSGGNSGSPVLNAKGQLIGTNFDRAYEGTMSDYYFDPKRCRNISVDIRFTLFIIEQFGGAGWLIDEMKIVNH